MRTKQVMASFIAILLTFLSGSNTYSFATSQNLQNNKPLSKAALCSGSFNYIFCGKNAECLAKTSATLQNPYSALSFVPQKSLQNELAAVPEVTEEEEGNAQFAYSYSIAQATPTVAATQTQTPTPTVAVQAASAVNPEVQPTGQGLNPEVIFSMVNQIRTQNGLAPFEKDGSICQLANERAPELYNEIFVSGTMHAGFARRQAQNQYWMTENMIHQNTEEQAVNWWMNSPVHRSAILGNYKYSCVSCAGNSCAMIFTSFVSKQ